GWRCRGPSADASSRRAPAVAHASFHSCVHASQPQPALVVATPERGRANPAKPEWHVGASDDASLLASPPSCPADPAKPEWHVGASDDASLLASPHSRPAAASELARESY